MDLTQTHGKSREVILKNKMNFWQMEKMEMFDVLRRCNERTHTNNDIFLQSAWIVWIFFFQFALVHEKSNNDHLMVDAATRSTFWHIKKGKLNKFEQKQKHSKTVRRKIFVKLGVKESIW